jgi:hypothetical protein
MAITMLEQYWDIEKTMNNPHKGWYIHYFDNGLERYGDRYNDTDDFHDFPGLDHIYLRLGWSYLEPQEGKFNWTIIDEVIDRWVARGYRIAFRITCKETGADQCHATPKWVMEAGATGTYFPTENGGQVWEPDYGDSVFLDKLDAFHSAFARRYDAMPWMAYVDIGSYGDWGEGHTVFGSNRDWPEEVIFHHLDIHCKHYNKAQLVISDDIVGNRKRGDGSRERVLRAVRERGITLRDDGISVESFFRNFGKSTLRNPEFFEEFWRERPIVLELEHYHATVDKDTWQAGEPFLEAAKEAHATYAGHHGYTRSWLQENLELAKKMGNLLGYWYFIKNIDVEETWILGKANELKIVWENHGLAPAYKQYNLYLSMQKVGETEQRWETRLWESDNRDWMPGCINGETYRVSLPQSLPPGDYKLGVKLVHDEGCGANRPVELGMSDGIRDAEGYYELKVICIK